MLASSFPVETVQMPDCFLGAANAERGNAKLSFLDAEFARIREVIFLDGHSWAERCLSLAKRRGPAVVARLPATEPATPFCSPVRKTPPAKSGSI